MKSVPNIQATPTALEPGAGWPSFHETSTFLSSFPGLLWELVLSTSYIFLMLDASASLRPKLS